ncbi:MAG: protein-glutamate O-methyltransferase CheR [Planctomycetes bacterium]|nr:protein-glutamate O-methyltransferase CheR [Planctomycetota bacterium]
MTLSEPQLSAAAYAFLADLVYRRSRIRLGPDKQAFVSGRLGGQLRAIGCDSFDAYCQLLGSPAGEDEVGAVIDLISTNHTQFFRESEHFEHLALQVLPRATGRPVRVWCAAAASGEEAYSLAIVLAEHFGDAGAEAWTLTASDISRRMLDRCRRAIYESSAVKIPDPALLPRYFRRGFGEWDGFYRVKPALRRRVKVEHVNLFQAAYPWPAGFDVIFCRNVMIYFDVESRQALVERLFEQLAPGGHLFVGHAEGLLGLRHRFRSVAPGVYQRPREARA